MSKGRVLVAMSGGIDSSIAALLLQEEGYEIVGVTLKTWEYSSTCSTGKETGCCSIDSFNDARDLAVRLGFPHYIIDVQKEFEENIISNFIEDYLNGRTPNPCVNCNTDIKWDYLLKQADKLNCRYIATGHYAQIIFENDRYFIRKGLDEIKDQSYVLWGLNQENLSRTLLPLGKYKKEEIKKLANDKGFENLSKKRESYEICFVPDNDYRSFLKSRVPDLEKKVDDGNFTDSNGKILGKHKGYPFYTIGQRKGLEVAVGHPLYVIDINAETNVIILGEKEKLYKNSLRANQINYIKYESIDKDTEFLAKVRYKDTGTKCFINQFEDYIEINFIDKVSAITPGQSVVVYENNDVVLGGVII